MTRKEDMKMIFVPLGTAIGISPRRLLSAGHMMFHGDIVYAIEIFNEDGVLESRIPARIERCSVTPDLAVLKVEEDIPYFIDPSGTDIKVGDWCYTIGAKNGLVPYSITWGQLSSKAAEPVPETWQSTISVSPGNSGGGVYNGKNHKLIGVMIYRWGENSNSMFVPIETIKKFLKDEPKKTFPVRVEKSNEESMMKKAEDLLKDIIGK
jgi:hypothetical protein